MAEIGSWEHVQLFSANSLPFRLRGLDRPWEPNSSHQQSISTKICQQGREVGSSFILNLT